MRVRVHGAEVALRWTNLALFLCWRHSNLPKAQSCGWRDRPISIVVVAMTHESARGVAAIIGVRYFGRPVLGHHIEIEVYEALPGDRCRRRAHAMCSVTDGTGESGVNVRAMLAPAQVQVCQIVALGAHRIGPSRTGAQVGIGIKVSGGDGLARAGCLRIQILAFQDVAVL